MGHIVLKVCAVLSSVIAAMAGLYLMSILARVGDMPTAMLAAGLGQLCLGLALALGPGLWALADVREAARATAGYARLVSQTLEPAERERQE